MKNVILATVAAATLASAASAESLNLSAGSDRIRTSHGAECQTSLDTGKYFHIESFANKDNMGNQTDFGVQVGVTFMLGMDKINSRRVDCNRMYDLQVQRDQLELIKMREEIALLRAQRKALLEGQAAATAAPAAGDDW